MLRRLLSPVPLSLQNPGTPALFIFLGTKGHKCVKSEMAAHEKIRRVVWTLKGAA